MVTFHGSRCVDFQSVLFPLRARYALITLTMETEPEVVVLDFLKVQPVKADEKKKVLGSVCPQQSART